MAHPKRVLIVDDNPVNVEIIEEILGDEFEILHAGSGETAIAIVKRKLPRVILLDVMLPGLDGYSVCRQLRRLHEARTARIIMVTAKAMPSERAQGFEAGADAYLTKPFDESDLWSAIRGDRVCRSAIAW